MKTKRVASYSNGVTCGGCNDCVLCLSALPEGKTCADCVHIYRCESFGFTDSKDNTFCSFIPSRAWLHREKP